MSTSFAPEIDGTVQALSLGPVANTVHVGGFFAGMVLSGSTLYFDNRTVSATVTNHLTPSVPVGSGGSWVRSYWADRNSSASAWTLPSSVSGLSYVEACFPVVLDATSTRRDDMSTVTRLHRWLS